MNEVWWMSDGSGRIIGGWERMRVVERWMKGKDE